MNDEKLKMLLLKFSIVMFIIIIILIIFPTFINVSNEKAQSQSKDTEQTVTQKAIMNEYIQNSSKMPAADILKDKVILCLDSFMEKLNTANYDGAYGMLDKEYIQIFNYTKEVFKAYNQYETGLSYKAELVSKGSDYFCYNVNIIEGKDNVIDSTTPYEKKYITVTYKNGIWAVIDRGVVNIHTANKTLQNGEYSLTASIKHEALMQDGIIYDITITNNGNKLIEMVGDRTSINITDGYNTFNHELINGSPQDYIIVPGSSISYLLSFKYANNAKVHKFYIKLKDGTKVIFQ